MQIKSIGIDLGKTTFHLVALGAHSQVVIRKKFSRQQLLTYAANLPSCLMGMEAGVGSHFLGRALREQGHEVRLIPAQFVRPFVKSNKNDYRDAEAIANSSIGRLVCSRSYGVITNLRPCGSRCQAFSISVSRTRSVSTRSSPLAACAITCCKASTKIF